MTGGFLKRYTNLASIIHILKHRKITLLDPGSWDDRNDTYFLERYAELNRLNKVFALCMTTEAETYHHWSIFARGTDGICIEFDKQKLIKSVEKQGVIARPVLYKKIEDITEAARHRDDLPFLKRFPYRDEGEFRLIYGCSNGDKPVYDVPFELSTIKRIHISPWMPESLSDCIKDVLASLIPSDTDIRLNRSTLVENERWKSAVKQLDTRKL
ncbi:DUF2971 domain-containing protein [Kordiimonas sp. SCSIO 12603]|uniref:DUF2971 domain-containing protein n=1 Tax=Kordiimonas sp. SCSIO 12603 TaxID=2829596 RepID=UPI002106924A|nr:DUF2971 domain-containing protein [Kordiimonas sp. SCSIO 12603]UTW59052.1 DUF2971 domain-containing protein [Kordiimonas sp. SCSIO 12603]